MYSGVTSNKVRKYSKSIINQEVIMAKANNLTSAPQKKESGAEQITEPLLDKLKLVINEQRRKLQVSWTVNTCRGDEERIGGGNGYCQ